MIPPREISMLFCPVCGRDDRYQPFTGKSHFMRGGRCAGTPLKVTYTVSTLARPEGASSPGVSAGLAAGVTVDG